MSTCNQLDLESLESWPTMPKNFMATTPCHGMDYKLEKKDGLYTITTYDFDDMSHEWTPTTRS